MTVERETDLEGMFIAEARSQRRRRVRVADLLAGALVVVGCGSVKNMQAQDAGSSGGLDATTDAAPDSPAPDASKMDGGTSATSPPSCASLPSTCGAAHNVNCCDAPEVPGGTFFRSYDVAGDSDSGTMNAPATVSTFRLDRFEVTVGRFRAFVTAGLGTRANPPAANAGAHRNIPGSGWDQSWNTSLTENLAGLVAAIQCTSLQTWTDFSGVNETRPMNCVSWYEAMAFCIWDGGYLPTEAEWNYAAAGGNEQRAYPWSNPASAVTIDGAHASYLQETDCIGDGMPGCTVFDLVEAGSRPLGDGKWGHSELAGNVIEWMLDWIGVYPANCVDCANLTSSPGRVVRGGSYEEAPDDARSAARSPVPPSLRNSTIGFRCARPQ